MAITILDKSAHQSFSLPEHRAFNQFFLQNLTPILVAEILADLSRKHGKRPPEDEVATLAKKFQGSGPAVNAEFRKLIIGDLLGNGPPLTPQVIIDYGHRVQDKDGEAVLVINPHPHNNAILRWRDGEFLEAERIVAELWRAVSANIAPDLFVQSLKQRGIILPDVGNLGDAIGAIDTMLGVPKMQMEWIGVLATHFSIAPAPSGQILARWRATPFATLKSLAPYAHHCLRVMLLNAVATQKRWVDPKPTNFLDTQYLYYLPFCHVFCSRDNFHKTLAPYLIRDDQSFVWADDLKVALKRLSEWWTSLTDDEKQQYHRDRGSYPPETAGCLVSQLWKTHCLPFAAPDVTREAVPDEVKQRIMERVRQADEASRTGNPLPPCDDGCEVLVLRKFISSPREIREQFGIEIAPDKPE